MRESEDGVNITWKRTKIVSFTLVKMTSRMKMTGWIPKLLRRTRNETNVTSTLLSNQQAHTVRFNVSSISFKAITALRDCSTTLNLGLGCPRNRWPIRQSNIMERTDAKKKVLFICTHNAAWSQMAEGFLRALYSNCYEAYSAGTEPTWLHPCAVKVMREMHIDIYFTYLACFVVDKLTAIAGTCDQLRTLPQINA